jgi:hypothetical protein
MNDLTECPTCAEKYGWLIWSKPSEPHGHLNHPIQEAGEGKLFAKYVALDVAELYEAALDIFDADSLPSSICELALKYCTDAELEHLPFRCPVCEYARPFEAGSGDCQACVTCCKCIGQTEGYCFPY